MNCILGISIWQTRWSRQEEAGICCGKFRPFNNAQCLQGIVLGKNTWNINQPIQVYTCTSIFIIHRYIHTYTVNHAYHEVQGMDNFTSL